MDSCTCGQPAYKVTYALTRISLRCYSIDYRYLAVCGTYPTNFGESYVYGGPRRAHRIARRRLARAWAKLRPTLDLPLHGGLDV